MVLEVVRRVISWRYQRQEPGQEEQQRHRNDQRPAQFLRALELSRTDRLSRYIDHMDNEHVKMQNEIKEGVPGETLYKVLSMPHDADTSDRTAVPDGLDAFREGTSAQLIAHDTPVRFRKIGFGQCGLILHKPGRDFVLKVGRPGFHDALWSDFVAHFHVYQAFYDQQGLACRVPKVYAYVNKDKDAWWDMHQPSLKGLQHASFPIPSMALVTERILPLPRCARDALVESYCHPDLQTAVKQDLSNQDCLVRIYLGKRSPKTTNLTPNFSLRNFNLYLDQMEDLHLPIFDYAHAMGEALAVIHWQANVDGYDIEFVLGSEADKPYTNDNTMDLGLTSTDITGLAPHTTTNTMTLDTTVAGELKNRLLRTRMWVLDFNLCSRWDAEAGWQEDQIQALTDQLVLAFFENDPYYPLPHAEGETGQKLWEAFGDAYLLKSLAIIPEDHPFYGLPVEFIYKCQRREKRKLAAGLGHGHRDLKG